MANELKFGDRVYIQNAYQSWQGGYLDTADHATGALYDVSTSKDKDRAGQGTGT